MRGLTLVLSVAVALAAEVEIYSIGGVPADTDCDTFTDMPQNVLTLPTNYDSVASPAPLTIIGKNLALNGYYIRPGKLTTGGAADCTPNAANSQLPIVLANGNPDAAGEGTYTFTLTAGATLCDEANAAGCANAWNKVSAAVASDTTDAVGAAGAVVSSTLSPLFRPLCLVQAANAAAANTATGGKFAGLFLTGTYGCDDNKVCADRRTRTSYGNKRLTQTRLDEFNAETSCAASAQGLKIGSCYDASTTSVCGARPMPTSMFRCCDAESETTARLQLAGEAMTKANRCPCRRNVNGATGAAISTRACPSGEECCVREKFFTEFSSVLRIGQCIDRDDERCCDTGEAFDPDTHQCCMINGKQSLDAPCPCEADADCRLASTVDIGVERTGSSFHSTRSMACCAQTRPQDARLAVCSEYANYPTGAVTDAAGNSNLPASSLRCRGSCIDLTYQTCCNGAICLKEFQRCCNDTCYNVFTESCATGRINVNSIFNTREWNMAYNKPTEIEAMNPIRAFWVFLLPTLLLLAGFGCLAIVLTFATKASYRNFSFVERSMMMLGIFGMLACVPLFFSPAYKYGVVVLLACAFTVLVASTRVRFITVACVVVTFLTVAYLVDPFLGNDYLNLSSDRTDKGRTEGMAGGIFHAVARNFPSAANFDASENQCIRFYEGYFQLDTKLQDNQRFDNPTVQRFGYCSRGWTLAVLIFSGIVYVIMLLLFLLSLIALLLRFRPKTASPIELEVVEQ